MKSKGGQEIGLELFTCFSWPTSSFLPFLEVASLLSQCLCSHQHLPFKWEWGQCSHIHNRANSCNHCHSVVFSALYCFYNFICPFVPQCVNACWTNNSLIAIRGILKVNKAWPLPSRPIRLSQGIRVTHQQKIMCISIIISNGHNIK